MFKVLPIGFRYQGKSCRRFEVNRINGFAERIIHNEDMQRERPQTWMASVLSCLVSEIEGMVVAADFVESNGKKIPDLVKHIALPDAGMILAVGHTTTFGNVLADQKSRCPFCRKENRVDIDLEAAECPTVNLDDEPLETLKVKLRTGWKRILDPLKAGQQVLGWEDKVFDEFEFGVPTVGNALRNEKYYGESQLLDFQVRLVNEQLRAVRATKDGFEMPTDMFEAYKAGNVFFSDRDGLYADDRLVIRTAINNLPQADFSSMPVACAHCSKEYKTGVGYGSFFPLAG